MAAVAVEAFLNNAGWASADTSREQVRVLEELAGLYDSDHRFTAADICRMHRLWLGRIYPWAGKYRQVNVKKDSFPFAAAAQIPITDGRIRRRSAQAPYALSLGIN